MSNEDMIEWALGLEEAAARAHAAYLACDFSGGNTQAQAQELHDSWVALGSARKRPEDKPVTSRDELRAFFLVDGASYVRYTPTSDDVNYDMHDTECTAEVLELVAKSGEQLEYSVRKQGELEGEIFGLQDRVKELEATNAQHNAREAALDREWGDRYQKVCAENEQLQKRCRELDR